MKNTMKRIVSIVLVAMILTTALAASAFAYDEYVEYIDLYEEEYYVVDYTEYYDYFDTYSNDVYVDYVEPSGGGIIYDNYSGSIEYVDVYEDYYPGSYVYNGPNGGGVIYADDYGKIEYIDVYDDTIVISNPYYGYGGYYYSNYNNYYNPYAYQYNAPKTYNAVILKNPTGETVNAGGKALFIAGSTNVKEMTWKLVSPDGKTTYDLAKGNYDKDMKDVSADAAKVFATERVKTFIDGNGFYNIELQNIGKEMSGWNLVAEFVGQDGGVVTTSSATITVR